MPVRTLRPALREAPGHRYWTLVRSAAEPTTRTSRLCGPGGSVRPDRETDRVEKRAPVHGLPEVGDRAGLLDVTPGRGIVVSRDEDGRDLDPIRRQALPELEPASVEMDVEHEAGRPEPRQRLEEVAGRDEALDRVPLRLDQPMERSKDGGVVVDDGNDVLAGHGSKLVDVAEPAYMDLGHIGGFVAGD